jgi:hypothetical protein
LIQDHELCLKKVGVFGREDLQLIISQVSRIKSVSVEVSLQILHSVASLVEELFANEYCVI